MNGNDFVKPLPFARASFRGVDYSILDSYRNNINRSGVSLLNTTYQNGKLRIKITESFLKNIFADLARIEGKCMLKKHEIIELRARESLDGKSEESILYHTPINNPLHPLYSEYGNHFNKIDYTKPYSVWKNQYYVENFGCTEVTQEFIIDVCRDYLESLLFTQYYYMNNVPHWRWKRKYNVAPLPSDIHYVLQRKFIKVNKITFEESQPLKWYEAIALAVPKHFYDSLPEQLQSLPTEFEEFFVDDVKINTLNNQKLIYADVDLPKIDDEVFLKRVNELCK
jgi:5'-3' exonuclease